MDTTCDLISNAIGVLVADSSQMQSQFLGRELRRRPEFQVTSCVMDLEVILYVMETLADSTGRAGGRRA